MFVLKFKNEFPGDIITEFISLKPKFFQFCLEVIIIIWFYFFNLLFGENIFLKVFYFGRIFFGRWKNCFVWKKNFFCLYNCDYWKTCESKRKRMLVRLVRDYQAALREISVLQFKSYKIFEENLAAVTSNPTKFYWDVPTIVWAIVFELSKFHMFKFHNDIMKTNFKCQILYSDTDSLPYEFKSEDLYHEISKKKKHFEWTWPVKLPKEPPSLRFKKQNGCFKIQGRVSRGHNNRVYIPQTQAFFNSVQR